MKVSKRKIRKIFYIIISVILMLSVFLNTYLLLKYNVLPFKYLMIYFLLVGLIPILLTFFTVFKKLKPYIRRIFIGIEIIYIIILCLVFFYLNKTFSFLDDFTDGFDYETKNYYVLVNKDSEYNELKNLENKKIGYFSSLDSSINTALEKIDDEVSLQHEEVEGFSTIIDKLYNDEIDGVLIVQSYYDLMVEGDETIKERTKIIYEFSIKEKVNSIIKERDVLNDTFFVYISGIDTFGSVTEKTRSDVNIVMGINPKTYQIMMINIPRDYYVNLFGINQKDKLTHAGIYGVEMSTKTIENLLGIEINYYVKLNFNAVIKTVDALGGVDVYSNYDFYSTEYSHHFKKGYNTVDGELALDFVRTRKAFLDGDRVRGENQEAMIQAIIDKACSPAILTKYDDILNSLEDCFTTNISSEKIMELVKMQLDKMPRWNITSLGLNGSDSYNYTYTYPGQELYVMVPNEKTIEISGDAFEDLKNGKILDETYKNMIEESIKTASAN
ncbi:MAG: LCP family protein [Bacilli bacterium]|nr:LCP family protein [Bacilli bacterium]